MAEIPIPGGGQKMYKTPVAIIILTYNEEKNIRTCLESTLDLTDELFIVDSFSIDQTLEIARQYTDKIFQNTWTNSPAQRQWALDHLPFTYDWVLFLDADELLTAPLKVEIAEVIRQGGKNPEIGGYYIPRKFFFLGKEIRWGGCRDGLKELRLCHRHSLKVADRGGRTVYLVAKLVGHLQEAMIHEDQKPLSAWISRHNRYSSEEAQLLYRIIHKQVKKGQPYRRLSPKDKRLYWKETIRETIFNRLPLGLRPISLFVYNYFFRLGFLDGGEGFIYHFFHNFWYRLIIDAKVIELQVNKSPGLTP